MKIISAIIEDGRIGGLSQITVGDKGWTKIELKPLMGIYCYREGTVEFIPMHRVTSVLFDDNVQERVVNDLKNMGIVSDSYRSFLDE